MTAYVYSPLEFPNESIWTFVKKKLKQLPANTVCLTQTETGHSVTNAQFMSQVENAARGFRKWGVKDGQVISVFCPNLIECLVVYCGLSEIGGVLHMANSMFKYEELRQQLVVCESIAVLTVPNLVPTVEKALNGLHWNVEIIVISDSPVKGNTLLSDIIALGSEETTLPELEDPRSKTCTIFFSSGTTGYPKGVEHTHGSMVAGMQQLFDIDYLGEGEPTDKQDVVLCFLPFFHIYAIIWVVLGSLIKCKHLVIISKFDINRYVSLIEKYRATILHIVPAVAIQLVNSNLNSFDHSSVRAVFCSAAPLSRAVQSRLVTMFNLKRIEQGYGMTELSGTHTNYKHADKPESVGIPHPGVEQKIVDLTTGEVMPPGQEGELRVRAVTQMKRYWRNQEATNAMVDEEGWVRTGDLAFLDSEGYLYITDRLKDILRYKGEQISPAEMEDLILSHHAVGDAAVIGIPDEMAGELPKAFVVRKQGKMVTDEEIFDFVAEHVSGCKKLRGGVTFVDKIPRNAAGKILRRYLRDQY